MNEIRAIAALMVLMHHVELYLSYYQLDFFYYNTYLNEFWSTIGKSGVSIFFVLSGFLISYLLLAEKSVGSVSLKKFYMRRVLRIWPLYFVVVLIGFVVIPFCSQFNYFNINKDWNLSSVNINLTSILLFVFFLSNFALSFGLRIAGASHTWSVSVE